VGQALPLSAAREDFQTGPALHRILAELLDDQIVTTRRPRQRDVEPVIGPGQPLPILSGKGHVENAAAAVRRRAHGEQRLLRVPDRAEQLATGRYGLRFQPAYGAIDQGDDVQPPLLATNPADESDTESIRREAPAACNVSYNLRRGFYRPLGGVYSQE
jgi:hypothetical protein